MVLSLPKSVRSLSHNRNVSVSGYLREDGLWDIEAEMRDIKSYDIENRDRGGIIEAGECLHNMWVRLTIDEDFLVHDAEAVTDASPYAVCGDITHVYRGLIGMSIAKGWNGGVRRAFGGVSGCTHITELLSVMGTVAFQTVFSDRVRRRRAEGIEVEQTSSHLNTCHALSLDGVVVERDYPEFYEGGGD